MPYPEPDDLPSIGVPELIADTSLADGCYHVFIDAGSNRGVHGRFLFEPHLYPKSKFVHKFDEYFGTNRTLQNICVFAFEPNPYHNKSQSTTQAAYQRMGWRYHYMPFGVGDENGQLTFYRNYDFVGGATHEEWGFSIHFHDGQSTTDQAVKVTVIDLSKWLQDVVLSRKIPQANEYDGDRQPTVIMKMDVEGSEYKTLHHMLEEGTACQIYKIIGEMHPNTAPQVVGGVEYKTKEELKGFQQDLLVRLRKGENCHGFDLFDDEEYLHDGMPYPEPDDLP